MEQFCTHATGSVCLPLGRGKDRCLPRTCNSLDHCYGCTHMHACTQTSGDTCAQRLIPVHTHRHHSCCFLHLCLSPPGLGLFQVRLCLFTKARNSSTGISQKRGHFRPSSVSRQEKTWVFVRKIGEILNQRTETAFTKSLFFSLYQFATCYDDHVSTLLDYIFI